MELSAEEDATDDVALPSTADYLVGVTIGEGAFGVVFHGKHKATQRNVAIKVVDKYSLAKYPNVLAGLFTERTVLSQWKSRYIIDLWASFHDEHSLYLVMECAMRGTLQDVIQQPSATTTTTTMTRQHWNQYIVPWYACQILHALEFVHSKHYIHADIKPDNILVMEDGNLKLADFGSAISVGHNDPIQERVVVGTTEYSSPEVIRGSTSLTIAVDLWSFGCVLYALLEGESPFHADSDALIISKIVQGNISFANITSLEWKDLIQGLLHPNPVARLGVSDVTKTSYTYSSLRKSPIFELMDSPSNPPPYVPTYPQWQRQAEIYPMRDGQQGWRAFVLDA